MIEPTLKYLSDALDSELRKLVGAGEPVVRLGSPGKQSGNAAGDGDNQILMTLINLEREGTARNTAQTVRQIEGATVRVVQPLNLNLIVLVSARFPDAYDQSLKALTGVVAFFQANPVFTPASAPGLPVGLQRLTVEWRDTDLQAMHNLWSALGCDYLPSVAYKVRMLVVDDLLGGPEADIITGIGVET